MNITRPFLELYGCGDLFDPRLMPYLKIKGKRMEYITIRDAGPREIAPEHRAMAAECYHLIGMILIRAAENYLTKHSGEEYFTHRHRSFATQLYNRAAYAMRQIFMAHLLFITNHAK